MKEKYAYVPVSFGLTEDEVKHLFVPFLKGFYKNRYQPDASGMTVSLDNTSTDGWIADGKITFLKPDGTPFVCTYEATSLDKIGEVKYQLNTDYFLWDAFAFGSLCAATALITLFEINLPWMLQLSAAGNMGIIFGFFIPGFFSWYILMKQWRKYRSIYAIEQFGQYAADEQWIVLSEDVFPSVLDPYYIELREQCIYRGVGLAIVNSDGTIRKICDPSRLGAFGKDRKITHWITKSDFYKQASGTFRAARESKPGKRDPLDDFLRKMGSRLVRVVSFPFKNMPGKGSGSSFSFGDLSFKRFARSYATQKMIALLSLFSCTVVFWNVTHHEVDEVTRLAGYNRLPKEDHSYLVDEDPSKPSREKKSVPTEDEFATPVPEKTVKTETKPTEKTDSITAGPDPTPVITAPGHPEDPCKLLSGSGWIIQEGVYKTEAEAQSRALYLRKWIEVTNYGPQSCVKKGSKGFIVWFDGVRPTEGVVISTVSAYEKALSRYGVLNNKLVIRKL
jgi:hypothetical protein